MIYGNREKFFSLGTIGKTNWALGKFCSAE